MKTSLFVLACLFNISAMVQGANFVWSGPTSGATASDFRNAANWTDEETKQPGSGSLSDYNSEGNVFTIGDGASFNIGSNSVDMRNAQLVIGNNVTSNHNWMFAWKKIRIGTGYVWTGTGDGLSLFSGSTLETNSAISTFQLKDGWNSGVTINLMQWGVLNTSGGGITQQRHQTYINASLDTINSTLNPGEFQLSYRDLIVGDLWNREQLYFSMYDENGNLMTNLNEGSGISGSKADWITDPTQENLADHLGEVYYVITDDGDWKGVRAYYVQAGGTIPEPSAAALGLLGLSGLLLRRRRAR